MPKFSTGKAYGNIPAPKTKEEADILNRKFREADYKRVQSQGFILGTEIRISDSPDNACSICHSCAGKYPKDFKWAGWHDGCKCHTLSITMGVDEFAEYQQSILKGTDKEFLSKVKGVDCLPPNLFSFIALNAEFCSKQEWYQQNKKYF